MKLQLTLKEKIAHSKQVDSLKVEIANYEHAANGKGPFTKYHEAKAIEMGAKLEEIIAVELLKRGIGDVDA